MYEVIHETPLNIAIVYVVIISACFLVYPLANLIIVALKGRDG